MELYYCLVVDMNLTDFCWVRLLDFRNGSWKDIENAMRSLSRITFVEYHKMQALNGLQI